MGQNGQPKVLLWVESLLGSGHMQVAAKASKALHERGFDVRVITGSWDELRTGFDFGNAEIIRLPRLFRNQDDGKYYTTPDFKCDYKSDRTWQDTRKEIVLRWYNMIKPNVLLFEIWPFAREAFNFELLPLVESAHRSNPTPQIYSIVRDVLFMTGGKGGHQKSSPADTAAFITQNFDGIFVTGDERFMDLGVSFSAASQLSGMTHYCGYFVEPAQLRLSKSDVTREVLVSSGGGYNDHSHRLYSSAIRAASFTSLADNPWVILVSHSCTPENFQALQALAEEEENVIRASGHSGSITVQRNDENFCARLADCRLIITQGGLNNTLEAMVAKVPTVIVPIMNLAQNEQLERAERLQESGLCKIATQDAILDQPTFASIIESALQKKDLPLPFKIQGHRELALQIHSRFSSRRIEASHAIV